MKTETKIRRRLAGRAAYAASHRRRTPPANPGRWYMAFGPAPLIAVTLIAVLHCTAGTISAADRQGAPPSGLYYARFDIKSVSGVVTASKLLVVPSAEEFRAEAFRRLAASGRSEGDKDALAAARHNALTHLLIDHGLKSVDTKRTTLNMSTHDEIVISYEGVLRLPLNVLKHGYVEGGKAYAVEMEVLFSPLAAPDRWALLSIRSRFSRVFRSIVSVFK